MTSTRPSTDLRLALCRHIFEPNRISLLAIDAGLNPARINFSKAAELVWADVLDECVRQGRALQAALLRECVAVAPILEADPVFQAARAAWAPGTFAEGRATSQATAAPESSRNAPGSAQQSSKDSRFDARELPLTLLHISDLHFGQARGSGADHFDQEKVVAELVKDAGRQAAKLGSPDAILVTGDVAFSAKPEQYARAAAWLEGLVAAVGVGKERIFLVPGNHDVDRAVAITGLARRNLHAALRARPAGLEDYLLPENAGELARDVWPKLEAWTTFAAGYGSPTLSPAEPFWRLELPMSGRWLVLLGLNSCLLSFDGDDSPKNLALGRGQLHRALQAVPARALVVTLLHHPLEWLVDGDELRKELQKSAHLLFAGHAHVAGGGASTPLGQRGLVRFDAGAAHASRGEPERHSYSWVKVEQEGVRWYPRAYHERWNEFRVDADRLEEGEVSQLLEAGTLPGPLRAWLG